MPKLMTEATTIVSLGDLLDQLGGIAPDRVRFHPPPGRAKEKHVVEVHDRENRLCELVHGVPPVPQWSDAGWWQRTARFQAVPAAVLRPHYTTQGEVIKGRPHAKYGRIGGWMGLGHMLDKRAGAGAGTNYGELSRYERPMTNEAAGGPER